MVFVLAIISTKNLLAYTYIRECDNGNVADLVFNNV